MIKRFGFNRPSSGLWDGEKCCLNSDGCFIKLMVEEKMHIQRKNS